MLAPPIVEVSHADGNVPVLLDGEHRLMLARKQNQKVRVVWIEGVPDHIPTVAKPVSWDDVTVYDSVPDFAHKRRFRFSTPELFPDVSSFSKQQVTTENYRYFFYRDLSRVATTGIRAKGTI